MGNVTKLFSRRQSRNRSRLKLRSSGRPRLSVFRSGRHIYAQIIDDANGKTMVAASTLDKDLRAILRSGGTKDAAVAVGKLVGARARAQGIDAVTFDRGGYRYHGRIKALADAAREAGLNF